MDTSTAPQDIEVDTTLSPECNGTNTPTTMVYSSSEDEEASSTCSVGSAGSLVMNNGGDHAFDNDDDDSFASIKAANDYDSAPPPPAVVIPAPDSITGIYSDIEHEYDIRPHETLGRGLISSVKACVHRDSGKRYAVKSIRKGDPRVHVQDLHREVELLKEVNHGNIVELVDVFEDEDWVHLVTDLCEGGELFDRIVRYKKKSDDDNTNNTNNNGDNNNDDAGGPRCFSEKEAACVLQQVLRAVRYLHGRDIVHRDIKPENICYISKTKNDNETTTTTTSPIIKLIDFGVARKHYEDSLERYMSTRVGTSYFIAPEVLRGKYDRSCDLWSVGVVAYVMMCGYPPFNGKSNREVCQAIKRGKYHFHRQNWRGVSKDGKDFIKRLLRANVRKRMTVEKALNHAWIVKNTAEGGAPQQQQQHRRKRSGIPSLFMSLKLDDNNGPDAAEGATPKQHRRKASGMPNIFTKSKDETTAVAVVPDVSDLNLDSILLPPKQHPQEHRRKKSGIPSLFGGSKQQSKDETAVVVPDLNLDNIPPKASELLFGGKEQPTTTTAPSKDDDDELELPQDNSDNSGASGTPPLPKQQHRRKRSGIPSLPVSLPPMFQKN